MNMLPMGIPIRLAVAFVGMIVIGVGYALGEGLVMIVGVFCIAGVALEVLGDIFGGFSL